MRTMRDRIAEINDVALENFDKAQGMLDMLNDIYGTKYGWLRKRVVRFDNPDASVCERYKNVHDAWVELQ